MAGRAPMSGGPDRCEDDAMRIVDFGLWRGARTRGAPPRRYSAVLGNTASILVFSVAALNGLTM